MQAKRAKVEPARFRVIAATADSRAVAPLGCDDSAVSCAFPMTNPPIHFRAGVRG